VRVSDVLAAVERLSRDDGLPATRTSVLTLVILATRADLGARAAAAVHELGGRHPARVLTLLADVGAATGEASLDAEVRLLGGSAEGHDVWFEDITLMVRGSVCHHLDSLIEPFTLPDLPVAVWFVEGLPEASDPLLAAADALVVDARELDDAGCFTTIAALSQHCPVIDLSWMRLRPWRALLAGLFDSPDFRTFLLDVTTAEVSGKVGPRLLMGGWLADRLNLEPHQLHLIVDDHVSLRLRALDTRGTTASFEVVREGDARAVHARASIDGGASISSMLRLPEATPSWGLADALTRIEHDPHYERAVLRAVTYSAAQ